MFVIQVNNTYKEYSDQKLYLEGNESSRKFVSHRQNIFKKRLGTILPFKVQNMPKTLFGNI